jgi:hypothetical protein
VIGQEPAQTFRITARQQARGSFVAFVAGRVVDGRCHSCTVAALANLPSDVVTRSASSPERKKRFVAKTFEFLGLGRVRASVPAPNGDANLAPAVRPNARRASHHAT